MAVILEVEKSDKKTEKAQEGLSKILALIKDMLQNLGNQQIDTEGGLAHLADELCTSDLLFWLIVNLHRVDFEGKKNVCQIFNNVLHQRLGDRYPAVDFICAKPDILFTLIKGYETQDIALNCGVMLRECARYEVLTKIMLYSEDFYNFFKYVEVCMFDIASDAFLTLKEFLTKHKMVCADFLDSNFEKVFGHYQRLLHSENYVTRRQSLKLLGELLLDRHNFNAMTRYSSSPDYLKLVMNILREKSRCIQFEAFHVFKIFIVNPNKPKAIVDHLLRNKEKLVDFLTNFHTDRSEDEQFNKEKTYLIQIIRELKSYQEN